MRAFVNSLGSDWFLFKYEDMVAKKFAALNEYLGFEIQADTEVPKSTGKAKVVRKKATGDWRQWFTEEDVKLFKPVYTPYMEVLGYNCDDWDISPNPVIEPEYSSMYIKSLLRRRPLDSIRWFRDTVIRPLKKKVHSRIGF
jgi:hypothetical protein